MGEIILSVKNLSVRFKDDKTKVLDNVSLDLYAGDVLAIDGLNGSGKSTLLNIIVGKTDRYIIEEGKIVYFPFSSKNILEFSEREMLKYLSEIGFVPQKDEYTGLNNLTVSDLIDNAIYDSDLTKEKAIELFNDYFSSSPKVKLKSIPGRLSGGEQRMISIFLGLICRNRTRLMIIDEPLNNLDFENVMKVSDLINRLRNNNKDSAMLMITHCKIITCVNRQRKMNEGKLEEKDSVYECHHCMGEPDCDLYYFGKQK